MELSVSGLTTIGTLLSFLLVFRVNICYSRFWEARSTIGAAVKACRDLAAQSCTFVRGEEDEDQHRRANILRLTRLSFSAIVHTVHAPASDLKWKNWTQQHSDFLNQGELHAHETQLVLTYPRPALVLLQLLRAAVFECTTAAVPLRMTSFQQMDTNISALIAAFHGVTKIASTPMPFPFVRMCKLFILIFVTIFPFALSETLVGGGERVSRGYMERDVVMAGKRREVVVLFSCVCARVQLLAYFSHTSVTPHP
jgi:putative membrane protein